MRPLVLTLVALALASACDDATPAPRPAPVPPAEPAEEARYVGRDSCLGCHPQQAAAFEGSHHDLAMQKPDPTTVLGDFEGAHFEHLGTTASFTHEDGRYRVRTEDAEGVPRDFEVAYTFGAYPLQQYLVPTEGGRLQALGIAWDSRPREEGGDRWFSLHPDEAIPPGDVLHWTGPAQNWNFMCAECHSTHVERRYDPVADTYDTRFSELDVSCEACHGPASLHVAWAASPDGDDRGLVVDLANDGSWSFGPDAPIAQRDPPRTHTPELDACGRCHARRAVLADGHTPGDPLLNAYHPALLEDGLYFADGQIDDEVYVWGSFLQSRMYAAGVTCSDCHDPHSLAVAEEPDDTCARCHEPAVFARTEHHGHTAGSEGASCVACHMPERTYMVVDARRDHGFRPPRPALSAALGAPDACTACHADRSADWAQAALERWGAGGEGERHFGAVLQAGRDGEPGAVQELAALARAGTQPGIVRASALRLLSGSPQPIATDGIVSGARDPDPLVRLAAAQAAERLPPPARLAIAPLLDDPLRAVRIEAARALADVPGELWAPGQRARLAAGLAEYRAAQEATAERPEAHVNLGILHTRLGELAEAEREYESALRLGRYYVPAYVNLADLYRSQGREAEAERALRAGLEWAEGEASLHHALGLTWVRMSRLPEALAALERAATLEPDEPRFGYVYGVALHSAGDPEAALRVLDGVHGRHPGNPEVLAGLATLSREAGRRDQALVYARKLMALNPADEGAQRLLAEIESEAEGP